jgi:predicted 2-oxoglutarate/Fe(II)-dependent dioxygenase YbiX
MDRCVADTYVHRQVTVDALYCACLADFGVAPVCDYEERWKVSWMRGRSSREASRSRILPFDTAILLLETRPKLMLDDRVISLLSAAHYRTGMPYCRPPFVQSAFWPRLIFKRDPSPTLRSKVSP